MAVFSLADRLGRLPDEIRQMSLEDFDKFLAFCRISARES